MDINEVSIQLTIVKERQSENIVDKLCIRFKHLTSPRQWQDISYCLSLLPYQSERSIRRLQEHVSLYHDALQDDTVFKYFQDILAKVRIKISIDSRKQRLNEYRSRDN